MRALIVADIHSNLEAFQAVLEDAQSTGGFDEVWCLGDTVGYGPDPGPCIDLLRHHPHRAVAGNHDWGATGKIGIDDFNPYAAAACRWTAQQLTPEHQHYLLSLPETEQWGDFTLVHGSLRSPIWEYLVSPESALETFRLLKSRYCLVGHSHLPFICRELPEG
ncbi:MAG: metallophosphoesterase family protein, partial [Dehalococcoidia bacterium]